MLKPERAKRTALLWALIGGAAMALPFGNKEVSDEALARAESIVADSASVLRKANYSKTIPYLFLSYDENGKVKKGVALRAFKTYEWVTALVVVEPDGDRLVVTEAAIPDIGLIKSKEKQDKVLSAIESIRGTVIQDENRTLKGIDAVTGATRYHKRIFVYFDSLAKAVLTEMGERPNAPPEAGE